MDNVHILYALCTAIVIRLNIFQYISTRLVAIFSCFISRTEIQVTQGQVAFVLFPAIINRMYGVQHFHVWFITLMTWLDVFSYVYVLFTTLTFFSIHSKLERTSIFINHMYSYYDQHRQVFLYVIFNALLISLFGQMGVIMTEVIFTELPTMFISVQYFNILLTALMVRHCRLVSLIGIFYYQQLQSG